MKKTIIRLFLVIIVALVAIQFVPVERDNPPVESEIAASPEVMKILEKACYDCHSHETKWPWYSKIAPVSWKIAEEVEEGREHLNFSKWAGQKPEQLKHTLHEMWEEVEEGKMPPANYLRMHEDAKLSDADKAALKAFCEKK